MKSIEAQIFQFFFFLATNDSMEKLTVYHGSLKSTLEMFYWIRKDTIAL